MIAKAAAEYPTATPQRQTQILAGLQKAEEMLPGVQAAMKP